jgi:hypothetical protein
MVTRRPTLRLLSIVLLTTGFVWNSFGQNKVDSVKLYLKCRNDLSLRYFMERYNPNISTLKITGGRIIENQDNDRIAVMPDSNVVILEIWQKGKVFNTIRMYAKRPPMPRVAAKINGKMHWAFYKKLGPAPLSVEIFPEAEPNFSSNLVRDSVYQVTEWTATLVRANKEIYKGTFQEKRMPQAEANRLRSLARSGDLMKITILSIKRRNALGEMIPDTLEDNVIEYTIQ